MRYFVTGDTHGGFRRILEFCEENETTVEDVMIICGDAGINYFCDYRDEQLKKLLATLPVTLFCVHGNHEERPFNLNYTTKEWNGGLVYWEEQFPNLLFAKDGEVYNIGGKTAMAIGGAYSVDKYYRLARGLHWFESELPTDEMKEFVWSQLEANDWKIDYMFTHTVPVAFEPTWAFLPGIDQSQVDKTLEVWLQKIVERLEFEKWYAGHYHLDSQVGPIRIMMHDYDMLETEELPEKKKEKRKYILISEEQVFEKERIMKKFLKNTMKKFYAFVDKYVMTGIGGLVLMVGILVSGAVMCIWRATVPYISSLLVILIFSLFSAVLYEEKGGNEK